MDKNQRSLSDSVVTIIPFPIKPVDMCQVITLNQIKVNSFIWEGYYSGES